jgi:hypothetical protein
MPRPVMVRTGAGVREVSWWPVKARMSTPAYKAGMTQTTGATDDPRLHVRVAEEIVLSAAEPPIKRSLTPRAGVPAVPSVTQGKPF